jgi:hypothetical protein
VLIAGYWPGSKNDTMDRKDNIWLNGFVFAIALAFKLFFFSLPKVLAPQHPSH